jgi:hypothetical protein
MGAGLTKNRETPKKVTALRRAITDRKPVGTPQAQGFTHYPHRFPHRYVNISWLKKLGNRENI